jgi:hypothetical protein
VTAAPLFIKYLIWRRSALQAQFGMQNHALVGTCEAPEKTNPAAAGFWCTGSIGVR